MRLDEQLLQLAEVARLIWLGNVVDHVDRHVVVEVVARIKHERRGMRLIGATETDRFLEGVERAVYRHGGGGVHHRERFTVQLLVERGAHVVEQRLQLIAAAIGLAAERCGVHVRLRFGEEDRSHRTQNVFEFHRDRRDLALHHARALDVLEVTHELLRRRHELLGAFAHRARVAGNRLERLRMTNLIVKPQVGVFVAASLLCWIEEKEVAYMRRELLDRFDKRATRRFRLARERVEQRGSFLVAGHHYRALSANEHVAGALLGRDTPRQVHQFVNGQLKRKRTARLVLGTVGLVHNPEAHGRK